MCSTSSKNKPYDNCDNNYSYLIIHALKEEFSLYFNHLHYRTRHPEAVVAVERLRDQVAPLFRANFGSSRSLSLQGTLAKFRKFLSLPQTDIP